MTVPVAAGRSAELYVGQGVALGLAGSCSGAVELELGLRPVQLLRPGSVCLPWHADAVSRLLGWRRRVAGRRC